MSVRNTNRRVPSNEEIIEALKIIQMTCEAQHSCDECPLGRDNDYGECGIQNADIEPSSWNINEPDRWRAF